MARVSGKLLGLVRIGLPSWFHQTKQIYQMPVSAYPRLGLENNIAIPVIQNTSLMV